VGESGRYVNQNTGIVYHYNGTQWSQIALEFSLTGLYTEGSLYGVWGSSDKNVFAVGGDFFGGGILNYDGNMWREAEIEVPNFLFGIWGSSLADIYAVGFGYRILHFEPAETTSSSSTTSTIGDDICPVELIYGELSREAALMRRFRDSVLCNTPTGREFLRLYCLLSPAIVRAMAGDEAFKKEVKQIIDCMVPIIEGALGAR
jgi:hypothetical protein